MDWSDTEATAEFDWLSFMAAYKYDGYRDYCAGARFLESLAIWLQQFNVLDRKVAYSFVKENLIYFSPGEIERLVEKLVPEEVQRNLIQQVASSLRISPYQVWSSPEYERAYSIERRKTLFMGLSDGARVDILRRMNSGVISNEQVVVATQIDVDKWKSLVSDLRENLREIGDDDADTAQFNTVYLVDDFTASGTSILPDPEIVGGLKGKLVKFLQSVERIREKPKEYHPFSHGYKICVHHYIATEDAKSRISTVFEKVKKEFESQFGVLNIEFSYGIVIPGSVTIGKDSEHPIAALCRKYYDPALEGKGKHGGQSGVKEKMFGYANCGLPVVLEHNTPNNSLALLWARTDSPDSPHRMRPLFYRRERHSDLEQVVISNSNGVENEQPV